MAEGDQERWNLRYRNGAGGGPPSSFMAESESHLPTRGRALDLAGGAGRHALWLAARGLDVTLVDVADAGLARAHAAATKADVPLRTEARDIESDGVPEGPWDVLLSFHFLWRGLFPALSGCLAPGGLVLYCHPTVRNLERNPHPSARFLLAEGELPGALSSELEVLRCDEGWHGERHEVRLVARRRG